jgi:hypothetical protein
MFDIESIVSFEITMSLDKRAFSDSLLINVRNARTRLKK